MTQKHLTLLTLPALLGTSALAQHAGFHAPAAKSAGTLPLSAAGGMVIAVPPSIKDTGAFVTLKNSSAKPINLTGASVAGNLADHAMLMHTVKNANMMGMLMAEKLVVPAGGTLTLKFNGDHIMMMGLKRPLKMGESVNLTVQADDGRTFTFAAAVKKP